MRLSFPHPLLVEVGMLKVKAIELYIYEEIRRRGKKM